MFKKLQLSLGDLLGEEYISSQVGANAFFDSENEDTYKALANEKIDFFPESKQKLYKELAKKIGDKVVGEFNNENKGAPTDSYKNAFNKDASPLSGRGSYRLGEDGTLYFVGKCEHYHSSLGHAFDGYKLIDNARKLNILNATHNNTRGYITRLLERELIRSVNGDVSDDKLEEILKSNEPHVLNRIISLETGSLAVEAGIKMMLSRFYSIQKGTSCKYEGLIPVFLVMADMAGYSEANYHGTTVIAQTFRNMWPSFYDKAQKSDLYKVVSVKINDINDFKEKIEKYNKAPYKVAGFMHEIVLMNYGGILLEKEYLQKAHKLCRETDTPVLVDEIQSCIWYKELFLHKKYGLTPDFVIIGKGFSGGEYPASKIITTKDMDTLTQFGALVTNGQEELASLSYLITMKFVQENGEIIEENQEYFFNKLLGLKRRYQSKIKSVEGLGYLAAIVFDTLDDAKDFAHKVNDMHIDVSAQTYKLNCPAAVLLKLPMILSKEEIDIVISKLESILA